jgi:glycosyltransferase involved in cell wall biosynthesis
MVNKSDIVITTSRILQRQMEEDFPDKKSYLIPNGCDINHFKPRGKTQKPNELEFHGGPIITYSGAWANWIDDELIKKIAFAFSNALVIVIGSKLCPFNNTDIPNLKYLGHKPYQELPRYLQSSTVCIIPFLMGQITSAASPIKMYEYLASGKPVVSTDIPEARNIPSVYIGVDHSTFIEKVRLILDNKIKFNEDEVYHWLASHTWEKRFEEILTLLCTQGLAK